MQGKQGGFIVGRFYVGNIGERSIFTSQCGNATNMDKQVASGGYIRLIDIQCQAGGVAQAMVDIVIRNGQSVHVVSSDTGTIKSGDFTVINGHMIPGYLHSAR